MDGPAEVQPDAAGGELVDDVAGVRDRAGEPVELGDDEGVTGSASGQRFAQAGPLAVGAGDAAVDVDALGLHAEGAEGLALRGEVLAVGADSGVADLDRGHGRSISGCPTLTGHCAGGSYGNSTGARQVPFDGGRGVPVTGSTYETA